MAAVFRASVVVALVVPMDRGMVMTDRDEHVPCWWSISEERLLDLLRRAHSGEEPELLYAEEYANADIEHVSGDDDV